MVTEQLIVILPIIVLAAFGIALPLMGGQESFRSGAKRGSLAAVALVGLAIAGLLSYASVFRVPGLGFMQSAVAAAEGTAFAIYEVTPFTVVFQLVFIVVAALVILGSPSYLVTRHQGEYYALLVLSVLGMSVVAASRDLITLFVGFETASLATFALAGYFKEAPDSSEASVKYFIIGALSGALTLFGISLVYGLTGSVDFQTLAAFSQNAAQQAEATGTFSPLAIFAWGFILTGFGFKIALVPFHNWAPDVYDGSPSTIGGFLAAGSKKMGFVALFKVFLVGLIALKANWFWIAAIIAVVTMTVGNVAALRQENIKRMLAYSSIAHAGYMLIALPIATQLALAGGIFQILTHGFMKTGAFLVVAALATVGVGEMLNQWKGVARRTPLLGLAMALFMLSLAGLPPLAGFTSKFVLFSAAIQAGGWFVWLAIAGIVNSAISLYYYARVIRVMYAEGDEDVPVRVKAPGAITAAITIAAIATVAIGLFPNAFIDLSLQAAATIMP